MRGLGKLARVADFILLGATAFGLGLFAFLLIRHGWDFKYTLLVGGAFLCALLLRSAPAARISLTLLLLSTGTALLLANFVLGVRQHVDREFPRSHWLEIRAGAAHIPVLARAAQKVGAPFDLRTRLDVMTDLWGRGIEAWPSISAPHLFAGWPSAYRDLVLHIDGTPLLPLGGISNTVTVYCNETGQHAVYESDDHGFANPRGLWTKKNIDIAVVGDSFAHGACVSYEQSFPALIRTRFPATLNLGNDGIGPLMELAIAQEYLPRLRPQTLVWTYFELNDFSDLRKEKDTFLVNYLQPGYSQHLYDKQSQIDHALKTYVRTVMDAGSLRATVYALTGGIGRYLSTQVEWERLMKFSYVWEAMSRVMGASAPSPEHHAWGPQPAAADHEFSLFRQVLHETKRLTQTWGGQMVFVYLPQYERYARPEFFDPNREKVLEIVRSLGIPVIDIHGTFQAQDDVLNLFPFRQPGHYTAEGYRLIADEILRYLDKPPHDL